MKASLCPVCNRSGDTCSSGKVWVEGDPIELELDWRRREGTGYYTNRCPECGADRSGLALTGCLEGSHYGASVEYTNDPHYYQA